MHIPSLCQPLLRSVKKKGDDENLPWDFIDHGIYKEHLLKEYKLALKGVLSDICRVGDFNHCGACA